MKCLYCEYTEQKVLDTRSARDDQAIRRRRECLKCGRRFTTFETPETHPLYVIKNDGTKEELNKEKILRGMVIASRKRPVRIEALKDAVDKIETQLYQDFESKVSSEEIGKRTLEALKQIDTIAYIRFASIYMHFQSPEEFSNIISTIDQIKEGQNNLTQGSVEREKLTANPTL